jgi:hypothetical protein
MNKVRRFLTAIALLATLGGFSLSGMAPASLANVAFSHHSASFVAGKSVGSLALKIYPPCPGGGSLDC